MLTDKKKPTTANEVLLSIRCDLYIANHALQFEEEMPQNERGGAHYTIMRLIERMDYLMETAEEDLEKIMVA